MVKCLLLKTKMIEMLARMFEVKDLNAILIFRFMTYSGGGKSFGFGMIYDYVKYTKKYE